MVQASGISITASNSLLWWLNGIGCSTTIPASYRKKLDNGDTLVGWKLSGTGIDQNCKGDQCSISAGKTIFGLTSASGNPVIKYVGFVTSPADYITTTGLNNVAAHNATNAVSSSAVYNLSGQRVTPTTMALTANAPHAVYIQRDAQGRVRKVISN